MAKEMMLDVVDIRAQHLQCKYVYIKRERVGRYVYNRKYMKRKGTRMYV